MLSMGHGHKNTGRRWRDTRESEIRRKEGLACPQISHQVVLCQLDHLSKGCWTVALDPLRRQFRKSSNKLLQHHKVDNTVSAASLIQQPPLLGVLELLGECKQVAELAQDQ